MANENYLVIVPVVMALLLIFGMTAIGRKPVTTSESTMTSLIATSDSECASCISWISESKCTDSATPVLGGVDVVNYFTAFKKADGTYDEDQVGIVGSSSFVSSYMGYQFHFVSEENKKLFEASPAKYAPQYGGFCTWGMSTEFCPSHPWSTDCLGPFGNWAHWTIQDDKLYFFWFGDARDKFRESDKASLIATADARWAEWYGGGKEAVFSTNCYSDVALPNDSSIKSKNRGS